MDYIREEIQELKKEISVKLENININLAKNNQCLEDYNKQLEIHIARTNKLEDRVHKIEVPFKITVWLFAIIGAGSALFTIIERAISLIK